MSFTEDEVREMLKNPDVADRNPQLANNAPGAPGACEATVRRKRGQGTEANPAPALRESEADFENCVVDYAHLKGWKVVGFRPARTNKGWRTPVKCDGQGWPDLVLVRWHSLIFAELKSENGSTTPEQSQWLAELRNVSQWGDGRSIATVRVCLWRPSDWPEIERMLA